MVAVLVPGLVVLISPSSVSWVHLVVFLCAFGVLTRRERGRPIRLFDFERGWGVHSAFLTVAASRIRAR
jgi:hypothetical protein